MTEEMEMAPEEAGMDNAYQSMAVVQDTLDQFLATANVDSVYGDPVAHGDALIIPCAEVLVGLAFGAGYGGGTNVAKGETGSPENQSGGGGGGGGGGRVLSRPVAVVVASPEGVRVEPVVDLTKIALAALTAGGFMTAMFMRMISPRRAMKEMRGE